MLPEARNDVKLTSLYQLILLPTAVMFAGKALPKHILVSAGKIGLSGRSRTITLYAAALLWQPLLDCVA